MSHISSVTIPLQDVDVLERALRELGLDPQRDHLVWDWYGKSVNGAVSVMTPRISHSRQNDYGVAFVKQGDDITVSADWEAVLPHETMKAFGGWHGEGSEKVFLDAVGTKYSELLVSDRMAMEGFTLESSATEDGVLTMNWARYR